MRPATLALSLALAAAAGCDGEEKGEPDADVPTDTPDLRGACGLADKIGWFSVQHELDYSAVSGEVKDGVVPISILEEVSQSGGCALLRRNNPECDPACQPGTTCDFDGTCIPYPQNKSVGQVVVLGLNKEVVMEAGAYFDTTMPPPAFDPGAHVRLDAAGEDYPSFELYGRGVTPIEVAGGTLVLREDQPLDVSWIASDDEQVHVLLTFNIDQHGSTPVTMFCEAPDTGSFSVPATMVNEFKNSGVSGFSSANLYRRTVDSVELEAGCIQFEIYSHRAADLQVEGHIPCDGPGDCPDGMTCDLPTNTCV